MAKVFRNQRRSGYDLDLRRSAPSLVVIELSGSVRASLGLPQGNVKNTAFVA